MPLVRVVINTLLVFLTALMPLALARAAERVALVIGNAAYPSAALINPTNDARAMSRLLEEAGFAVAMHTDTSLEALRQAVVRFGQQIKDPSVKFALFYYAGHGVQLDWHNYIIPVSARIRSAADIRAQTVDISDLLKYMREARAKNYVVILDACRDDPFAGTYRPPLKGLSQFDAPAGSVLAYSTAPGMVSFDDGGTNGLYTAYLLKEFSVKGVKIEDAFKRTRLNVRLASNGRQVPWETTSLEEDLYLFPTASKNLSDAEQDALLEQELQAWAKVRSTTDFLELANFIRMYPSGNVSELAAARLNRLLAQQHFREQRVMASRSESLRDAEMEWLASQAALKAAVEKAEQARLETERAEALRVAAERREQERQETARAAAARAEAARQEASRHEARRLQAAKLAAEQAEQARLVAEQKQREQAEAIRWAAERDKVARQEAADTAASREIERLLALNREIELARASQREALRIAAAAEQEAQRVSAERLALEQAQAKAQALQREETARLEAARQQAAQEQLAQAETARVALVAQQAAKLEAEAAQSALRAKQDGEPSGAQGGSQDAFASSTGLLPATPFFSGSSEYVRRYSVGDEFQFRVLDQFTRIQSPKGLSMRVTAIDLNGDRVEFNNGEYVSDLMGNVLTNLVGSSSTPRQFYPAEIVVGKRWTTRFKQVRPKQPQPLVTFKYDLKVVGKERITVPAGTFEAFKIEARGLNMDGGPMTGARIDRNIWVAPGVNADIAHETTVRRPNGSIEYSDRQELVSFKQAATVPLSSMASR